MSKKISIVATLLFLALIAASLASCSSQQRVVTKLQEVHFRDTLCVYEKDSIIIDRTPDTITIDRWHTRYRDREIIKEVPVEVEVQLPPERYIPQFYKSCTIGFFVLLVLIVLCIALAIVTRR